MTEKPARVDAHFHLWDLSLKKNNWLLGENEEGFLGDLTALKKTYDVIKYKNDINGFFTKSVHIQAGWNSNDAVGESQWLYQLDKEYNNIPAIVAFADLSQVDFKEILERQAEIPIVKGIRQIVAWNKLSHLNCCPGNLLENPTWRHNFSALRNYNFAFDLQIYPEQTDSAYQLAKSNPDIKIVIEHGLQPLQADADYLIFWKEQLKKLALLPNVYIKISGFFMFHININEDLLRYFILTIVEVFSPQKCMIGSNFPVELLFIKSDELINVYVNIMSELSKEEEQQVLGKTAQEFYGF